MAEMLTGINGEIIKWAREYYNMTQSDAALAIGVDIGRYCNWEDGTESHGWRQSEAWSAAPWSL